jgi:hypothetical protein
LNPNHKTGFNLAFAKQILDKAFSQQIEHWNQYQKKYGSRREFMKKSLRIEPVHSGKDLIALSAKDALIGTLPDLSLGTKTDKCTSISCALLPEQEVEGPPMQFFELYDKRNVAYKTSNLSKMTSEQMANFQLLVRMDIQYLSSVDVEWQVPEGGGASPEASREEKDADSADGAMRRVIRRKLLLILHLAPLLLLSPSQRVVVVVLLTRKVAARKVAPRLRRREGRREGPGINSLM